MKYGILLGLTSFLLIFVPVFAGFVQHQDDPSRLLSFDIEELIPIGDQDLAFRFVGFEARDEEFSEVILYFEIRSPLTRDVALNEFSATIHNSDTGTLLGTVTVENLPLVLSGGSNTTLAVVVTTTAEGRQELNDLRGQEVYVDVSDVTLDVEGITIDVEMGMEEIGPVEVPP